MKSLYRLFATLAVLLALGWASIQTTQAHDVPTGISAQDLADFTPESDVPCGGVLPSHGFVAVYGWLNLKVGAEVIAFNPRGERVGCQTVTDEDGRLRFLSIFWEDATANPPIPGVRYGDQISFKVDGVPHAADPSVVVGDWDIMELSSLTPSVPTGPDCDPFIPSTTCFDVTVNFASRNQQVGERFQIGFERQGDPVEAYAELYLPAGLGTSTCPNGECWMRVDFPAGGIGITGFGHTFTANWPGTFEVVVQFWIGDKAAYTETLSIEIAPVTVVPTFSIQGDLENWSPGRVITHTMVISSALAYNATFYYGSGSLSNYAKPVHNQIEVGGRKGTCSQFNYESGYYWCEFRFFSGTTTVAVPYLNTSDHATSFRPVFMLDLEPIAESRDSVIGWYNAQSIQTDPCDGQVHGQGATNWVTGTVNAASKSVVRAHNSSGAVLGCTIVNEDGGLGWFGLAPGETGEEISFTIDSLAVETCPLIVTRSDSTIGTIKVDIGFACSSVTLVQIFLPLAQNQAVVR